MATVPDIALSYENYTNLYSTSGIPVGTEILIQNKSPGWIVLQNSATQPASESWDGFLIPQLGVWVAEQGTAGVWAKGSGTVAVEARG